MEQENSKRASGLCGPTKRAGLLRLQKPNIPSSCRESVAEKPTEVSRCRPQHESNLIQKTKKAESFRVSKAVKNASPPPRVPHIPVQRPFYVSDVDKNDHEDPQQCSEYVTDIQNHLLHEERRPYYAVKADFLAGQLSVGAWHRSVLVDWLVDVSAKFHLSNVTLHVMVDLMDRYLEVTQVPKQKLQLIGVTSLLLACKYEEIFCPSVCDIAYITDNTYSQKDICSMELDILKTLDYRLSKPVALDFLRRYAKVAQATALEYNLAKYVLELALMDEVSSSVLPSLKAAAALLMSRTMLLSTDGEAMWTSRMAHFTGYRLTDFGHVADLLKSAVRRLHFHARLRAVRDKYSSRTHAQVSTLPCLRCL